VENTGEGVATSIPWPGSTRFDQVRAGSSYLEPARTWSQICSKPNSITPSWSQIGPRLRQRLLALKVTVAQGIITNQCGGDWYTLVVPVLCGVIWSWYSGLLRWYTKHVPCLMYVTWQPCTHHVPLYKLLYCDTLRQYGSTAAYIMTRCWQVRYGGAEKVINWVEICERVRALANSSKVRGWFSTSEWMTGYSRRSGLR